MDMGTIANQKSASAAKTASRPSFKSQALTGIATGIAVSLLATALEPHREPLRTLVETTLILAVGPAVLYAVSRMNTPKFLSSHLKTTLLATTAQLATLTFMMLMERF